MTFSQLCDEMKQFTGYNCTLQFGCDKCPINKQDAYIKNEYEQLLEEMPSGLCLEKDSHSAAPYQGWMVVPSITFCNDNCIDITEDLPTDVGFGEDPLTALRDASSKLWKIE